MARVRLCLWAALPFACIMLATIGWADDLKTVTLTTDPEKPGGFLLELTVEAFKEVGYKSDVRFEPWARALDAAMNGEVDGLLGCLYSDERAKKLAYSDELAQSSTVFFTLESSKISYERLQDLSKYTIGTIRNSYYPPEFLAANLRTEPAADYEVNIRKLLAGRIDLFIEKRLVVMSYIAAAPTSETSRIVALEPPIMVNRYYNGFAKGRPSAEEKLHDFNRGLQMIKDDGMYAIILRKSAHE